jgi:hypothetical protein
LRVLGWALIGALVAGGLTFAGILVYARVFDPSEAGDIRAWQEFSAMMGGLGAASVGFLVGAVYGAVRARNGTKEGK